jgi:mRNA degradation ribonuclease J1/J2
VLKDRSLLAQLGIAIVTMLVDDRGRPVGECDVMTRGVMHEDEEYALLDEACATVHDALHDARWVSDRPQIGELEELAARALKRFFARSIGKKPLCYAVIHRQGS